MTTSASARPRAASPTRASLTPARLSRQRLVLDDDSLGRVGRAVRVVGDHDGDGLSDVAHAARRQHGMAVVRPAGLADQRRDGRGELGRLRRRQHGDHAGETARAAGIDPRDARVGVRAAHDRRMQGARHAQIVHVATTARYEAMVFLALDGSANQDCMAPPKRCSSRRAWSALSE